MKLWKQNRLDQEYEMPNAEIARQFQESDYAKNENGRGTDFNLVLFIASKDGLNSSWEFDEQKGSIEGSNDFLEVLKLLRQRK